MENNLYIWSDIKECIMNNIMRHVSGPDFYERVNGITATVTIALSLSGSNSIDDGGCRIDLSVTK